MIRNIRWLTYCIIALALCFQVSCASNQFGQNVERNRNEDGVRALQLTSNSERIPLMRYEGSVYFPIYDLLKTIGYRSLQEKQSYAIGDIDPFYKINIDSTRAVKEEQEIQLSGKPTMINDKLHLPVSVLADLFQLDIHYEIQNNDLVVHPVTDDNMSLEDLEGNEDEVNDGPLFFQDDPNDPFKDGSARDQSALSNINRQNVSDYLSFENDIDMNDLIVTAEKYLGVPYDFGAKPYPVSKKFDCSSFTQYVYKQFGVDLARISRNQAKQGQYVSKSNLRKGDLVFFSVPGRFKSDKIVGHVGIYISDGKMIDTYSEKYGVKITDINKGFWRDKYLLARRVAY